MTDDPDNVVMVLGLAVYATVALACLGIWWLQVRRTNGRLRTDRRRERVAAE